MDFNTIRYELLQQLIKKYPEEGRLHFLLALEEAASGENQIAKDRLGEAAKFCDPTMKADIIDLMCHLYSGKSFIPVRPTDRGKDIFFEIEKFSLRPEYTQDELDDIEKMAEELAMDDSKINFKFDEDSEEIYPPNLRLVQDNEFIV